VRRVVARAAEGGRGGAQALRVVNGYIESDGWLEPYRKLSIPLRRTLLPSDKANFGAALEVLRHADSPDVRQRADEIAARYRQFLAEMDTALTLGGTRVKRGAMFRAWLDATVFYDHPERCRPYEEMVESMGKAVEANSLELARDMADQVLDLDEAIGAAGIPEPAPPEPFRPPPPDPPRTWAEVFQSMRTRLPLWSRDRD
jgi:hypothetical protein